MDSNFIQWCVHSEFAHGVATGAVFTWIGIAAGIIAGRYIYNGH